MVRRPRQNSKRPQARQDTVLFLRPEFPGQPVCVHKVYTFVPPLLTTVTSGAIISNSTLVASTLIPNLATRFAGYSEFRIVKVIAKVRCYSTTNPGILVMWFSEDDSTAPTATKAISSVAKEFSASANLPEHTLTYVPHDPAQQTWTLVSSGAPVIGYHKLYTDNANFGSSIVATPYCTLAFESTVQFRGFI
jgi:hypothetical protein